MALHEVQLKGYSVRPGNLSLGTFDSYGIEKIHVTTDDEWVELDILAVFHAPNGTATKVVIGADGILAVPPEATSNQAGNGRIVFAGLAKNVQRITVDMGYNIKPHSDIEGDNPGMPTPDVVQQILENSNHAVSIATAAQDAAENARQAAEDAAKKAGEGAGGAAASAAAAKKSAEDAAASSKSATGKAEESASSANTANESAKAAQTAQGGAENAAQAAADAAGVAGQASGVAVKSAEAAETAKQRAENAAKDALEAKTGSENALQDADAAKDAASGYADAAAERATAAAASEKNAAKSANSAADSATAAKTSEDAAAKSAEMAKTAETGAGSSAAAAKNSASTASTAASTATTQATAAKSSETAAAKSADDAKNYAAQAAGIVTSQAIFGVNFSGSTSAGTRVGAAKDFVFAPGTDTSAGQNSFDAVYPWAGMRRCCCTLNADGTVKVNAYKGQPGYIEDGTNGEVLVEIPLFYVSGMLDVAPSISMSMLPGYRAPRKFLNADGSLKQKCYVRAFPGSIGADGKLHSIAGAVPTGSQDITRFLNAARKWGDTYSVGTSADFEVLAYLMVVVYGTRNSQIEINGCVSLYNANIAVAAATDNAASVVVAKSASIEPGMVISIGTGNEDETIAKRRIVTSVEAIDGDATNVKVNFDGNPVTTTTDHKVWRIMQGTGTANSVIATCGSPVSNTDGRHSFVFYGVENPLYGNQWRFECDWKLFDGVPYWCDDPTKYSWTSNDGYIALDTMAMPDEGWATALQQDDRAPSVQITKSVGGSSGTYLADYFYINKAGTLIALRGGYSSGGGRVGPFGVRLSGVAGYAWWNIGGDLSIPG